MLVTERKDRRAQRLWHEVKNFVPSNLRVQLLFVVFLFSVLTVVGQKQEGIASFYSKKATGARTASGERLHHDSLTCAHLTYPFGSLLKVTNPATDRSVIVRVTDRGPFLRGRIIDLSWGAARQLGILSQGIASVIVERIGSIVIPFKDSEQLKLPELGLATMSFYQGSKPEWQDSVAINHKRLHKQMEQTARDSWIDMIMNRLKMLKQ